MLSVFAFRWCVQYKFIGRLCIACCVDQKTHRISIKFSLYFCVLKFQRSHIENEQKRTLNWIQKFIRQFFPLSWFQTTEKKRNILNILAVCILPVCIFFSLWLSIIANDKVQTSFKVFLESAKRREKQIAFFWLFLLRSPHVKSHQIHSVVGGYLCLPYV